ncbi:MAG: ATP-binding cassette domain-containing protein [Pelosinus sp.]|nr:ATP-binding cassette domain-containing protein [Pelosinus sp.]
MWDKFAEQKIKTIFLQYPYAADFFTLLPDVTSYRESTLREYFLGLTDEELVDSGQERAALIEQFVSFMMQMEQFKKNDDKIESITIVGGKNKKGQPENIKLMMCPGEIICIVGPTGSGKSRLLADIEWLAQKDTPTQRQILINGKVPAVNMRFAVEHKLVAQLSQNMNFIMDLTVTEFVTMHAESRMLEDASKITAKIIAKANELAGEPFSPETPVTALSGGQSRALMIADTAYLSSSPIVLIDEIENAGIDRQRALDLLIDRQKIVLMATHDPILALSGDKRLVIKNGGIYKILATTLAEHENLTVLTAWDRRLSAIRDLLRSGEAIDELPDYFAKATRKKWVAS